MSIDLTKLTSAPWHTGGTTFRPSGPRKNVWSEAAKGMQSGEILAENCRANDAEFIALARNAFDILMCRGWSVYRRSNKKWAVDVPLRIPHDGGIAVFERDDPFTAVDEAEKWYKEHVVRRHENDVKSRANFNADSQ